MGDARPPPLPHSALFPHLPVFVCPPDSTLPLSLSLSLSKADVGVSVYMVHPFLSPSPLSSTLARNGSASTACSAFELQAPGRSCPAWKSSRSWRFLEAWSLLYQVCSAPLDSSSRRSQAVVYSPVSLSCRQDPGWSVVRGVRVLEGEQRFQLPRVRHSTFLCSVLLTSRNRVVRRFAETCRRIADSASGCPVERHLPGAGTAGGRNSAAGSIGDGCLRVYVLCTDLDELTRRQWRGMQASGEMRGWGQHMQLRGGMRWCHGSLGCVREGGISVLVLVYFLQSVGELDREGEGTG